MSVMYFGSAFRKPTFRLHMGVAVKTQDGPRLRLDSKKLGYPSSGLCVYIALLPSPLPGLEKTLDQKA